MSVPLKRSIAIAGVALLVGGALLLGVTPAQAEQAPAVLSLEIAGPDGVFVPVASGAQFAVSSTTATTARWTLTNPTATSKTGYYLYTYGPDCLVSDLTIAAGATFVCTEVIPPEALETVPTYGVKDLGALGGIYDGSDFPIAYPLRIDIVDDTNGKSFSLSQTTVDAEGTVVISGSGFDEDDALTGILSSTPVNLGAFPITGGAFTHSLTLPAGLEPGTHTITLYSNGVAYSVRTFELLGAASSGTGTSDAARQLAATGVEATAPLAVGGTVLALGMTVLLVTRRRRITSR